MTDLGVGAVTVGYQSIVLVKWKFPIIRIRNAILRGRNDLWERSLKYTVHSKFLRQNLGDLW